MSEDMTTTPDQLEDEQAVEDFDAFWTEHRAGRKPRVTTIMGEQVELPHSLPLRFELEAKRLQRSKRDRDVKRLVGILFGDGALDRWTEKGMDLEQFKVLLAWAPRAIAGQKLTLAEVAREVDRLEAEGEAPDPT